VSRVASRRIGEVAPRAAGVLASLLFALAPPAAVAQDRMAAFQSACASGDSLALEALWKDLRGLATRGEIEEWEASPVASRCAFLEDMLAERAVRAGMSVDERLALHYERLAKVRDDWWLRKKRVQAGAADSLGRHPDLMFDDRGLIYLRMGEPDEVAYAIAGGTQAMGNRIEGWAYDRPGGRRIYFFSPVTTMGIGVADYRLLDAPWRAVGAWHGATQMDLVNMAVIGAAGRAPLMDLLLSFQGLDPYYATLAYRSVRGGTELLQDLNEDRLKTMGDIRFAVDSVPDAPEVDPSLRFAWEHLRFLDPSSGRTVVWLVAAARAGDLAAEQTPEGLSVYRLDLSAAVRIGKDVKRDSVRTVYSFPGEPGDEDALISRIPLSVGPGEHPFTVIVVDGNTRAGGTDGREDPGDDVEPVGNWDRGVATGLTLSDLPEVSDIAVAADSGGSWTRDGETFLAVTPSHITGSNGEIHLYFEAYGVEATMPYSVEVRVVPEALADRLWEVAPGETAFRLSFASQMPSTGGIGSHHLRLDLSESPGGPYTLGIRITEPARERTSLPITTPIVRAD